MFVPLGEYGADDAYTTSKFGENIYLNCFFRFFYRPLLFYYRKEKKEKNKVI
jgi:hypothetical protein